MQANSNNNKRPLQYRLLLPIGLCLTALSTVSLAKQSAPRPENNNSSSCSGLLKAAANTPADSVARQNLIAKLYDRDCGEDTDGDLLLDFEELLIYFTDPANPDTDGDNLLDGEELLQYTTDPLNPDSDGDALMDGDEVLVYLTDPLNTDSDNDRLTDGEEVLTYVTDPTSVDTDEDMLEDGDEVLDYLTNPNSADTDSDKLTDYAELFQYFTNPVAADSDGDALDDGDEVLVYLTDPLAPDTDNDRLTDGEEVQTYATHPLHDDSDSDLVSDGDEVIDYLTDPLNADTDGDALIDGWEIYGHPNGTLLPDANPRRQDIYVEMDYMVREDASYGLGPNQTVLDGIVEVFANAPRNNPDGSTGIDIHLEMGNEVPYDDDLNPSSVEFYALRDSHFDTKRSPVYHYMIWANGYNGTSSSGVSFGIPASDFIVSMGKWNGGAGATDNQKIGTFIHELGHNLGLKHGGTDHVNYKPNYISVMNYSFQVYGIKTPGGLTFDYQRFDLPDIDENALSETAGLNAGAEWAGYKTYFYCSYYNRVETDIAPIDWNCDGNAISEDVSADINRDSNKTVLSSQNNWQNIEFNGGDVGSGVASKARSLQPLTPLTVENEEPELTWEEFVKHQ